MSNTINVNYMTRAYNQYQQKKAAKDQEKDCLLYTSSISVCHASIGWICKQNRFAVSWWLDLYVCLLYTSPLHLVQEYGGLRNRKLIDFFVKFAVTCFERYKDKVKYWRTFNAVSYTHLQYSQ